MEQGAGQLTEESLMRALQGARGRREREEDEDSEDDLEIVSYHIPLTIFTLEGQERNS